MKLSYNWLKWYIPEIPAPEKLADVFTYHLTEVESVETFIGRDGTDPKSSYDERASDTIFDINILPNRAHDLLSHRGVAKELSGLLNIAFVDPTLSYKKPESVPTDLKINIESENCRRYSARIIRGVKVGQPAEWMVGHLESIGQRSINNVVDATNIVMFNIGQPTHAFDLAKIKGNIKIRNAKAGEKITILGGEEKELLETDTVIADDEGALAIAGVKGGIKAEVDENTKDIVIEVANFDPVSVRKTARRLGIQTDSTKRFENDLSPEYATLGMTELSALIFEMFPEASFEEVVDVYETKEKWQEKRKIVVSLRDIEKVLGTSVDLATVSNIFLALGFAFSETNGIFSVFPAPERLDINIKEDLIEEVARFVGYHKVEPVMPVIKNAPKINETFSQVFAVRQKLLDDGYFETMTYTFTKKGAIEVIKGLKGKSALRKNILDGLKQSYEMNRLNAPLIGQDEIKIFEIGSVFPKKDVEEIHVAFVDKKEAKEFTLSDFAKEFNLDISSYAFKDEPEDLHENTFKAWSPYPFIVRDIAVFIPNDTDKKEIEEILKSADLLARAPRLIDEYQKDYETSYAYRLVFQSDEKTLTDDEVAPIMAEIYKKLEAKGWKIR